MKYAEVILPLSVENSYTYFIPEDMRKSVVAGCRVIVHFGKKRYYTAIVKEVHDRTPSSQYETKEVFALLDSSPVLRRPQLRFWEWISSYYLCKLGDVYKAALPSGLKLESETSVVCKEDFVATEPLKSTEYAVLDAFGIKSRLTVSELEKITGLRNVLPILTSLLAKGAIEVSEELKKGYAPRKVPYIRLAEAFCKDENLLETAFDGLKRAPRQEELLIAYLSLSNTFNTPIAKEVSKKELLDYACSNSITLNSLIKKGILEIYEKVVSRLKIPVARLNPLKQLTEAQEKAYGEIHEVFQQKEVCLLHGVTSSGKTEVYSHLIDQVLANGRQVLYLLPEIAVTTQMTERLASLFGDKMYVYHSRFSDNDRVEVWNRLLHGQEPCLIVGVRSSLFLPFRDLGLVIVDEEQEYTFKQQDPAPRYHARNAAIVLASMHGAKTLIGSATPSIDSYYNAMSGKYGLVELNSRYNEWQPPEIIPVDTKELKRKKIMKHSLFSPLLIDSIGQALEQKEQVILFQNRRGFAPLIECSSCGYVPRCIHCDVSLTYHKYHNQLVCHYCGYKYQVPVQCPDCQGTDLKKVGVGTEKVEEDIQTLFPDVSVDRLDLDNARTKTAYERIIGEFEEGKTQILIGTQMLSKGLDFGNVSVVGIINADSLMNYPDFRAHERAFQLMVQVSGRAGRRDKRGKVILQTTQPQHPIIRMVQMFGYKEMVELQLSERKLFRYPPYYRLIHIIIRGRNEAALHDMSGKYTDLLRNQLGERVLGPVTPPVTRIQSLYIRKVLLKIEVTASIPIVRKIMEDAHATMQKHLPYRQLLIHFDVDPL